MDLDPAPLECHIYGLDMTVGHQAFSSPREGCADVVRNAIQGYSTSRQTRENPKLSDDYLCKLRTSGLSSLIVGKDSDEGAS